MLRGLPVRRLLFGVLLVTMSTQPVFILGASFFQIGDEFGVGPDGLGVLTAAFFLTAGLTSPGLGRWVQRIGWRKAVRFNIVASGVLMLATSLFASSIVALALLLVASAAVYGAANPAANAALAEVSSAGRRATIFGIKHAGIPGSTLVAGALVPAVVLSHGWRWAYVVGACLAVIVWLVVPGAAEVQQAIEADPSRGAELSVQLLIRLGLASALAAWSATSLGTFLVSASIDGGMSEKSSGLLLTIGSFVTIAARLVVGMITDKKGATAWSGLMVLMAVGSVVFWSMAFAGPDLYVVLVLMAFATGWGWPGLMTYAVVDANRSSVASSSAITQAGVFVGAGVGPFVLGQVAGRVSFDAMWAVVASALLVGAFLTSRVRNAAIAVAS